MASHPWRVGDTVGNEYSAQPAGFTRPIPGTDWGAPNPTYGQGNTGGAGGGTGIPAQKEPGDTRTEPTERTQDTLESYQERIARALELLADPDVQIRLRDADLGRELQLADKYGELARRRDIEMQNIRSWQAIQQAQINRDALMAASMMNTAFLAHTPNASIVQALQGPMQVAAQAFKGA
jgi:hypothetical protein